LTFSLKYLLNFAKSAPLSKNVTLNMSNEVPLLVAFEFEQGHINYYLAPKVSSDASQVALADSIHLYRSETTRPLSHCTNLA
jgi:hypothetical protein